MGGKRKASQDLRGQSLPVDQTLTFEGPPEDAKSRDSHYTELYSKAPDFQQLALQDADFARLWNKHKTDFFKDPECVMQLTKSLLKLDFGLKLELPDDRLCPPVLNRHNYLLWLKDLLDSTSYEKQDRQIVGLDIGTGASCIYPLMGCTERDWEFIATGNPFTTPLTIAPLIRTDIDPKSLEYAYKNVILNELGNRIKVVGRKPTDALIPLDDLKINNISFTMSNPPFYKSEEELLESARKKSRPPFTACTGAKVEMVTDGGEIAFVDRMLKESLVLQERVQWYTSMFGFLTSLIEFVDKLREHKIDNYAVTEFVQGSKTRRWAVAWSFGNMRPTQSVARGVKTAVSKNVLPEITEEKVVDIPLQKKIGDFADCFRSELEKLDLITWEWDTERLEGIGRAAGRVWARAWRRRKQRGETEDQKVVDVKCEFAFKVSIRVGKDAVEVHCRWLEGHDPVAFESFRGYLKKTARNIINLQSTEDKA
ncbi:23S rRNA (-N6)-methyltransferase [Fusarium pseudoanthophilum]|uniref:23S rRNA (-N6)-methyltransferase n=1 Tax=Fusarium pseudoanthophilum TaxID=48495 RepID=A0A8H5L359_9HYPO|nr:23S rRNA (-N6)-methyltransferase [Fusarium pseudoanthophilum]